MRIFAHRGRHGSGRHENTLEAVRAAFAAGADGVEVDLRLSDDGVLVAVHDPDLRRLAGSACQVATTGWADLRAAAAGRGVALSRVEDVVTGAGGGHLVLELKRPPAGRSPQPTAHVLAERLQALRSGGVPVDVTVSSFSPRIVAEVRRAVPDGSPVRTALLGRPGTLAWSLLRQALEAGHAEIHPHLYALLATPRCVAAAHACGVSVVAWTVNNGAAARQLDRLGVDACISDVPQTLRSVLRAPVSRLG